MISMAQCWLAASLLCLVCSHLSSVMLVAISVERGAAQQSQESQLQSPVEQQGASGPAPFRIVPNGPPTLIESSG